MKIRMPKELRDENAPPWGDHKARRAWHGARADFFLGRARFCLLVSRVFFAIALTCFLVVILLTVKP